MRLAKDLLGCTSDLLRLLARTNHLKLHRMGIGVDTTVGGELLALQYYALAMAPDHASGEGLAEGYFGFIPTSGPHQSLSITS